MIKEAVLFFIIVMHTITRHDNNGQKFGQNKHSRTKLMPTT